MRSSSMVVGLGLAIVLLTGPAIAEKVWTFDCDGDQWTAQNTVTITWENRAGGKMIYVPDDGAGDPYGGTTDTAGLTVADDTIVRVSISGMTNVPDATNLAVFMFSDDGGGHGGFAQAISGTGAQIMTWDLAASDPSDDGGYKNGTNITQVRFDFAQGAALTGAEFEVDWVYVGNDANFEPAEQDTTQCNFTAYQVGSAPTLDGAFDANEYPGDPWVVNTDNSFLVDWGTNQQVDASDCSFDLYGVWTTEALYIAMVVRDNTLKPGFDAGDFQQIVLAPANATGKVGSLADFTFESASDPMGFTWRNNGGGGGDAWDVNADGIDGAFATTADGYVLEAKFPWADMPFGAVTPAEGTELSYLACVVDRDTADSAESNVFVITDGVADRNPFENHEDIGTLTLMGGLVPMPVALRFDCDTDGFGATNNVTVDSIPGYMIVAPTGPDPYTRASVNVLGSTLTQVGAVIEVQNAPDANPITCGFFWHSDAGWSHVDFDVNDGANIVWLDLSAEASWDDSVDMVRFDLPQGGEQALIDAGTVFIFDVVAFAEANDYIPDPWTIDNDCDNDGLSNDTEATLGTDPYLTDTDGDGVADGVEVQYGSDPLDPQDTVTVPVMTWAGLAFMALLLAAAALVVASRRRSMSY